MGYHSLEKDKIREYCRGEKEEGAKGCKDRKIKMRNRRGERGKLTPSGERASFGVKGRERV
jgi:hypothetical protein